MSSSLFSPQWYRVAQLRVRLRPQVRVQRQHWRDERWYLLSDAATGRQHRINDGAYQFIGRCDGRRSVQEVWDGLLHADPDKAPTQEEVLRLLGQLNEMELLQSDQAAATEALLERRTERLRRRRHTMLNPFSFRLPLGDPADWLARLDPLAHALFRPLTFWLWVAAMSLAILLAAAEWPTLSSHAAQHLITPASIATAWLCYPAMKALHELAHALAVRRWGGEVHEYGIGLMLLVPAPYVDASAASAFPRRMQRAMVGAAGVVTELTLAALGLVVFLLTQPGVVHDTAFAVMFIGTASTLLFNGNPLLRFDAYHVVCDLFDVPNLAARSGAWWHQRLGRVLLGSAMEPTSHSASERAWLLAYAPLSLVYRVVLSVHLVLWVGGHWLLLGLASAVYAVVTALLQPLLRWARHAHSSAVPGSGQARVRLRLGLAVVGVLAVLALVPLPFSTVAPAVVWLPDEARVRPEVDGFVVELPRADGSAVKPGDLLLRMSNPELLAAREQLASQLEELSVEHHQALLRDPGAAQNLWLDIARTEGELRRADERIARLQVHAKTAGTLVMPRQADLLGTYMRHGVTLGHVLAPGELRVRAAVPEQDVQLVRERLRHARVRLSDAPGEAWPAALAGGVPASTRELPSAALADHGGGPYISDPAEKDGLHSLEPVFLFDLTLSGRTLDRVGGRAWVRFDYGSEALAPRAYRRAAQLFLRHFSTSD